MLCQEIAATPSWGEPLNTVFFGGGTPSLLPVKYLEQILETLDRQFGIAPEAEISMEVDPGTFTKDQLRGYQQAGVNRFSLGVQAFQDELLQVCGRSHTLADVYGAVDLIHQLGIANFSLDLISGLPQQTLEQWQFSLETAIAIAPKHLSCYDLVLEPVTAFGKQYQPGERPLPSDEMAAQMYRLAQSLLTQAGYQHYEISNYAQPGYQCRHNRVYWENRAFYGFGMGAASYVQQQRFTRPRKRQEYFTWVEQGNRESFFIETATDRLLETLMLGLRLAEGVRLAPIRHQFSETTVQAIARCLEAYTRQGWVEFIDVEGNLLDASHLKPTSSLERIRLTDPEGFLFSNRVLTTLFENLDGES